MENQNWSDVGNNISDIVQQAIDSQDFSKLSAAIQDTVSIAVGSAVNGVAKGVGGAAENTVSSISKSMSAVGDSINQMADSMMKREGAIPAAQNPWKGNGRFERKTSTYLKAKDIPETSLYSIGNMTRLGGWVLSIIGGVATFGLGMAMLILLIVALTAGGEGAYAAAPMGILLVIMLPFAYMFYSGRTTLGRLERFKNYIRILGKRTCVSIKELATGIGKDEAYTRRDVSGMLRRGMFRQGHLDENGKNLFVTHEGYHAYIESKEHTEARRTAREAVAAAKRSAQNASKTNDALFGDVKKTIAEGQGYIEQIRAANDAIRDEAVSRKLDGLETVVTKIFQYVEEHPESAPETKKLMKYYLPTTIRLLDSYQKLSDQPISGQNIDASKKQIEDTLDTLNQAFARLFDNLYQDTSMDINSDISVLHTLLAQEGLTGEKL